jgi:hypothetical protein
MQTMSPIRRDFLASNLRTQVIRLRFILNNMENDEKSDHQYVCQVLREIENNIRQLRKSFEES